MKKMVASALATAVLLTSGVAMAADVKFDGDLKLHYRWNTWEGDPNTEGGKVWFRLNATTALSDNVDAYARFAVQALSADAIGADYDKDYYGDSAASLDRFGVVVKGKDFKYNIGRQGVSIGALATLYSTEGYMGTNYGAIDGVVAKGKSGATDLQFVAGQEWKKGSDDSKIYAVSATYSPAKNWTLGGVVGKYESKDATDDTTNYAVNASYSMGKATLLGEYAKSDANTLDTAYAAGVAYGFDAKHSAYAFYSKVENNADMGGWTDWDAYGKGIYVGYDYKWTKDTTFSFFYKDMKWLSNNADYSSLRATMTYKF